MRAIADTGPLVAFFDRSERYHRWTTDRIDELDAPLLVCEPVLTETIYLLTRFPRAQDALFGLLQNGALLLTFRLEEHIGTLHRLLRKYRDIPMSLADACVDAPLRAQTWKLSPQPQRPFSFGLTNVNPDASAFVS
jgi:uncharacterized protein